MFQASVETEDTHTEPFINISKAQSVFEKDSIYFKNRLYNLIHLVAM